eukprot:6181951-Pleurochrysis_carterae.AAC.2
MLRRVGGYNLSWEHAGEELAAGYVGQGMRKMSRPSEHGRQRCTTQTKSVIGLNEKRACSAAGPACAHHPGGPPRLPSGRTCVVHIARLDDLENLRLLDVEPQCAHRNLDTATQQLHSHRQQRPKAHPTEVVEKSATAAPHSSCSTVDVATMRVPESPASEVSIYRLLHREGKAPCLPFKLHLRAACSSGEAHNEASLSTTTEAAAPPNCSLFKCPVTFTGPMQQECEGQMVSCFLAFRRIASGDIPRASDMRPSEAIRNMIELAGTD